MVIYLELYLGNRGLTQPHQKCDAKQPCTACANSNRGAACTYDLRQQSRPPNVRSSSPKTSANALSKPSTSLPSGLPPITWSDSSGSAPSLFSSPLPRERPLTLTVRSPWDFSPHIYDETLLGPSSDVLAIHEEPGATKRIPHPTVSSFAILPSIHFQTIPRPLRIPLSFISPEHTQVSGVARRDLDMTLYVVFTVSSVFTGSQGLKHGFPVA